MGLSLRKLFKAREKPGEDVQRVSSVEITDQQVRDAVTEICLRELAFWTCVGKIANALTKCEFRTFYEGEELFKDEYYLWNYEPNRNQNKAEFLSKAMEQLFRNNELLIVESYDGQLLVADDFSVTKNALYGDTYTNVQVDDYTFSRSFRSSDVLHWTLNNKNVNRIIQHLYLQPLRFKVVSETEKTKTDDATLVDLKIGALKLSPTFTAETTEYTATTQNASNTITAVPASSTAEIEITVGDVKVTNGAAANWSEGSNTVTVKVTDGAQTKSYKVTVTKE